MYEVIAYADSTENYGLMGQYDTLEKAHDAINHEGCRWIACACGDEDYRVCYNGEVIERWY